MKKQLFAIATLFVAFCSCQKAETSFNELVPGNEDNTTPQQIVISSNLIGDEILTKASVDYWNSQEIFIVGYDNSEISSATTVSGFILPNVKATAPAFTPNSGLDSLKGNLAFASPYYYNEDVDSYDFNGFYLGEGIEAEADDITITNGIMTIPFTIDGSQDVLGAITDIENDRKINEGTQMVKKDYVYSAFASRHGVTPTLVFNHMLTKFSFEVQYGSNAGEDTFSLDSIEIATGRAGILTLNPAERAVPYVEKTGEDSTVVLDCQEFVIASAKEDYQPAGYLMVMPNETNYDMTLSYHQEGTDDQTHQYNVSIDILKVAFDTDVADADKDKFLPGKQYKVKVKVYGLQEIEVNVELVPWDEMGYIVFDPDDQEGKIEDVE